MKIKWESNSRAKALASEGKIKSEDIIPRTTTDNFPTDAVTVRMANMSKKKLNYQNYKQNIGYLQYYVLCILLNKTYGYICSNK